MTSETPRRPSVFLSELDTHQISSPSSLDDTQLVLDTDLVFWDAETELYYIAPAGTVTDLASVPLAILGSVLTSARAAVEHDAAYRNRLYFNTPARVDAALPPILWTGTRAEADALLYRAMLASGFGYARSYAWWAGVRTFAGPAWRRGHA